MKAIRRLFRSRPAERMAPVMQDTLPRPESPVYVIGDIHGRADLMDPLWPLLDEQVTVVTVGDYIDRGENSAQVLRQLFERQTSAPDKFVCLMGNHEKMLIDFLDHPAERGRRWLRNGGLQTLASFGVGGVSETADGQRLIDASLALHSAMGGEMVQWLRDLPLMWQSGNLYVVHGAADPYLPMDQQDPKVLLWGHGDFLRMPRGDGNWVAHGHTIVDMPEQRQSRIALDTGAYYSDRLTAAKLHPNGGVEFLQATPST